MCEQFLSVTCVYTYIPIYYIKLKSRLSVRPSALFCMPVTQSFKHQLNPDLLKMIAASSDIAKYVLQASTSCYVFTVVHKRHNCQPKFDKMCWLKCSVGNTIAWHIGDCGSNPPDCIIFLPIFKNFLPDGRCQAH